MISWRLKILVAALGIFPAAASADVVFRGDFETGDLSQWTKAQAVQADRMQTIDSPVKQGRYAMRVEVREGDNPIGASGNRNELVWTSFEPAGTERWYRWQTLWPLDYPSAESWQVFTQWHHVGPNGSPPMVFSVRGESVRLLANTEVVWTTPLERGVWHDFVFHVMWSPDASEGFVELWYDGKKVLPLTRTATQFPGEVNYLKQGLYRDAAIGPTAVIFHDGMTVGTSAADVMDPPGSTPPAGDPQAPFDPSPFEPRPGGAPVTDDDLGGPGWPDDGTFEPPAGGCQTAGGLALPAVGLVAAALGLRRRKRR